MIYRLPEPGDKEILQAYVQEHYDCGETSITASLGLTGSPYDEWVEKIHRNAAAGDGLWGRSLLYLCFSGETLAGLLSIRYELSKEQSEKYGDIGYGVRPSERRKGFASEMLRHALAVCREKGKEQILVGCYKANRASAETIRKNGGILAAENDNYKKGVLSQYYVIKL